MTKKVFVKTWGCQMNVRDSEVIAGLMKKAGYILADKPDEADITILNTCSVRQHAEDKVWSELGRLNKFMVGLRTKPIIGLIGCMAKNYKEGIFQRAAVVDFVVGPSDIHKIPEIVKRLLQVRGSRSQGDLFARKIWETEGQVRPEEIYHTGFHEDKKHAYVVISEGCSNYCSYCVVPYVRGELRHRNSQDILKEIEEALDKGISHITLLGQNVNAYKSQVNFIGLLELVNNVEGLKEFSFVTSHPKDTSPDLFRAMADLEKLKNHLHLPIQSGSDRILKLMNRGYTAKFYLDLVEKYRRIIPGAVLTTDIIVGFPSETEEDFRETHRLVEKVEFNAAFIFKYSSRPHTQAERLCDDVAKAEKEKRHEVILNLQRRISKESRRDND